MRSSRIGPLWAKAPLALVRYPAAAAGLAIGAISLSLVVAAFPLFLSATASNLVWDAIDDSGVGRFGAGVSFRFAGLPLDLRGPGGSGPLYERLDALFARRAKQPALGEPFVGIAGPALFVSAEGGGAPIDGQIFASAGSTDHIEVVSGAEGSGVWIPEVIARALGVGPGDVVELRSIRRVNVTVDGVYRTLASQPMTPYWFAWSDYIRDPTCQQIACPDPPQFVITDMGDVLDLTRALGEDNADFIWQAPVVQPRSLTLEEARALERFATRFTREGTDPSTPFGQAATCCFDRFFGNPTAFRSQIPFVVLGAERRLAQVEGPARLLEAAGVLIAVAVVAFAGVFLVAGRRTEFDLSLARGYGPLSIVARAGAEGLPVCLLGGAIGSALAFALVAAIGPDGVVSAGATASAIARSGAAVMLSLLLLASVVGVSYLRRSEHHRTRLSVLAGLPWEIVPAILSLILLRRLQEGGGLVEGSAPGVERLSPELLLFPILFLAGFGTIAARGLTLAFAKLRTASGRSNGVAFLAAHRLAAKPRLTRLLVVASLLCLGVAMEARTMILSIERTVDAKAKVYVGSDVQARIELNSSLPNDAPVPVTRVTRLPNAGDLVPNGAAFDLLTIDPDTFAAAAFWDPSFSSKELGRLLDRLTQDEGPEVPIALAGPDLPAVSAFELGGLRVPVSVVDMPRAFPGMTSTRPLIVVSESTLLGVFEGASNPLNEPRSSVELWIRGDPERARSMLATLPYVPSLVVTAAEVKEIPWFAAVVGTLTVLDALALVAALLLGVGLLVYLQARQRSQIVSYGLSLRMGMTHALHGRALATELGSMLAPAFVTGGALAVLAASAVVPMLDPLSSIPPGPILVLPVRTAAILGTAVMVVAWLGARIANRQARASDLGEVMRLA